MNREKRYPFTRRKDDAESKDESFALLKEWRSKLESDKGGRAALKRAGTIAEIMFVSPYYGLLSLIRRNGYAVARSKVGHLAAIAALVARVEEDVPGELGSSSARLQPEGDRLSPN